MSRTVVCVTEAFGKPKALSDLVIFSDYRPYIPTGDLQSYLKYCSTYAREHKVFLVPHRFVVDHVLYLCLFDRNGSIVGYQGAMHRNLSSQNVLEPYSTVHVMQTSIGNLFLCVDTDIYYPEVLRLAKLKGADLVISSQFIHSYDFKPKRITTGIWNAAQQNGLFVVGCSNAFTAVAAPWDITADKTGFLVQPEHSQHLFCKLFFNKLERSASGGELAERLNQPFCKQYAAILGQR
ncbi:MAG: hypothetical protein ACI4L5_00860 [Negativibacillus sp.]